MNQSTCYIKKQVRSTSQPPQKIPYRSNEAFYRLHTPDWTSNKRRTPYRNNDPKNEYHSYNNPLKEMKENRLFYFIDFS
ncbi:hypothetical protein JTE90_012024 [Oedothorax gibbosus]|uniref:Uncharacterized protein n=1 Tax=Oedothorax gibbosus TaxID=931172 RepID=A0AAV6UCA5_9ARAC|nr:hypothetical protein JTE90_012024 [Oedothorax gibbosus]